MLGKLGANSPWRRRSGSLRQHPAEVAAAEDVQMEVRHFLVPVAAGVGEDAVPGLLEALLAGDLAGGPEQRRELDVSAIGREIVERDVWTLRDHQDVHGCLRADVAEGEDMG